MAKAKLRSSPKYMKNPGFGLPPMTEWTVKTEPKTGNLFEIVAFNHRTNGPAIHFKNDDGSYIFYNLLGPEI